MELCMDENRLKELMKQAMMEMLEDRKEVIYELFSEIIEDIGLARAIEEGEETDSVDRREVFDILHGDRE